MRPRVEELTDHQRRMLRFLETYMNRHGRAPSIREIRDAMQMKSEDHVHRDVKRLEELGFLRITPRIARGIELLYCWDGAQYGTGVLVIPHYGEIAAGLPLPKPDDSAVDTLTLTRDLVGDTRDVYAMKVRGFSMIDALINDGDTVILRHVDTAENGDLVAVWIETDKGGETTLKRFFHEGDRIRLQPENATMQPIYCDPAQVRVQGKVIAVIRQV